MSAAAPALRLLVTIVQIAALLALAWSAPVAHGYHDARHDCGRHHAHEAVAAIADDVATAVRAETGSSAPDQGSAAGIHACCHHVVALAPDASVQPVRWTRSAGLTPEPEAAKTGVTPEALPKPPRSRA